MESLFDDSVCCKLCGQVFESPVILTCGHSICLDCAEASLSFQQLKILNPNSGCNVICPTCSKTTHIPVNTEIKNFLKPNYDLRDVIERLKKVVLCGNECGASATIGCANCNLSFCEACFKDCHSKSAFKSHQKSPLSSKKTAASSCKNHNKELDLYCKKCSIPVCYLCSGFGEHKGHECILLQEASNPLKSEALLGVKELTSRAKSLQELVQTVEKEMSNVKSEHEKFNSQLKQSCQELIEMIKSKERELLSFSQEIETKKLKQLQQQMNKVKGSSDKLLQLSKEYQSTSAAVTNPNEIAHLGQAVKVALQQFNLNDFQRTPCVSSALNFQVNASECKKAISSVASIKHIEEGPSPSQSVSKLKGFVLDKRGIGIELQPNSLTAVKSLSNHATAIADVIFSSGVHYWEVSITKLLTNIFVGIVRCNVEKLDTHLGQTEHSWGYNQGGWIWHRGEYSNYGGAFKSGDSIGVLLDLNKFTLSFYKDKKNLGVAYNLPKDSYSPAISLYAKDECATLVPNPSFKWQ